MTCNECSGNGGYYDRANGERYLSDPEDGTLWQRCEACNGTGEEPDKDVAQAVAMLEQLNEDQRLEVFRNFCVHCGKDDLPCYCMRDE